ncbi:MAG: ATP-binding protein [Ruminococcus sp.]
MGYSREIQDAAMGKIESRRNYALQEAEIRKSKIFQEVPEAESYERNISSCAVAAARTVLNGGNVKAELEKLKNKSLKLQEEYKTVLLKGGYTPEDLEPKYTCDKCSDTGFIEIDNKTIMCDCLKQAMVECACAELNRNSPLSLCTFEDFSLDYYSKTVEENYPRSSYDQMSNILNYCKKYADSFTKNSNSLFMKGKTGLGKTHLCLAIANEVIKKGYGVIYVSAPAIVSKLEKEHFSYGNSREKTSTEDSLIDCDLLIIDDLGTEFTTQFSTSAIYNIFNSRLLANKPVIINTNLTLQELEKLYSQRFVSRITGQAVRLDFFGQDIRIMKK